jgi:Fur family transcriptional regulator, ferric uptake regulator
LQPGAIAMSCFNTLKKNGLRLTPQRKIILDLIHERGEHITAEEIINFVQKKMPEVNKSTIYRTLELLGKAGCVYKSESGNEIVFHHAAEGCHYHVICQKCGKTADIEEDLFQSVEDTLKEEYGFLVNFKHIVIQGLCENCKNLSG